MRHKMLRIIIALLIVSAFLFLAAQACSSWLLKQIYKDIGGRDWRIILPYDYEIQKINGNSIILVKDGWSSNSNIVISDYINAYSYNDTYIGVWCAKDGASDLLGIDSEEDIFYIVDTTKSVLVGRYTKKEYEDYCLEQQILELNDWIYTTPRPEDAIFK